MPPAVHASLEEYKAKRDFRVTAEPRGRRGRRQGFSYLIQKHDARRLHYDFRLELDGVLKSWAVTRGPSLDPAEKRLAVRTEDHPLEYGKFEGTIPKGEYGGGTVMLWDRGSWEPVGDPHEGLAKGKLDFILHGERLRGGFTLVRMRFDREKRSGRENWLLIKKRDEEADAQRDPIAEYQDSVVTQRGLDEIAAGRKAKAATTKREKLGPLPSFVSPQLAFLRDLPPDGPNWIHEIKYDGYRVQAAVSGGEVVLYTRAGKDWTKKFGPIANAFAELGVRALIDGEVVVFEKSGRTHFSQLQEALASGQADELQFVAFDLLNVDGKDMRQRPLMERKQKLKELIGKGNGVILYGDHIEGAANKVLGQACKLGIEGLVSKEITSPYVSRRSLTWIKSKCFGRSEFVIGGFRPSTKQGRPFASLLIGEWSREGLIYRGRVGTGYNQDIFADLGPRLRKLVQEESSFAQIPRDIARHARWVKPEIVAEIGYAGKTRDGMLRHPIFAGLREDKPVTEIDSSDEGGGETTVSAEGVRLTHPDHIFYPEDGISKSDVADYLRLAAPQILKYAADHPVSLLRCPDGTGEKCFFQKHASRGMPDGFKIIPIREKEGDVEDYLFIDDTAGLIGAAQIGALELHIWGSRRDKLEHPDRVVFDLDPAPDVPFGDVKKAAVDLRDLLAAADLTSLPLLTGGKGVHVVVPLDQSNSWDEVKSFARALANRIAEREPARFVATASKTQRTGRIFIDWLRNERGSTAIAPLSLRARQGAPVAVPVSWDELKRSKAANAFNIKSAATRIKRLKRDPWAGYEKKQKILADTIKALEAE